MELLKLYNAYVLAIFLLSMTLSYMSNELNHSYAQNENPSIREPITDQNSNSSIDPQIFQFLLTLASTSGIAGAIISTIIGYHYNFKEKKIENEIYRKNNLYNDRIASYGILTQSLARVSPFNIDKQYKNMNDVQILLSDITEWYYGHKGALLMGEESFKQFQKFQTLLNETIVKAEGKMELLEEDKTKSIANGEDLRKSLLRDLQSI